jgi:hypothetical protein
MTTNAVETKSQSKYQSLKPCKSALIDKSRDWTIACASGASSGDPWGKYIAQDEASDERRTQMMVSFLKFLIGAAITYVIVILLCVWEFTIGIKESIKNLLMG